MRPFVGSPDYLFDSQNTPNLIAKKLAIAIEEQIPTIAQCVGTGEVVEEGTVLVTLKWASKENLEQVRTLTISISNDVLSRDYSDDGEEVDLPTDGTFNTSITATGEGIPATDSAGTSGIVLSSAAGNVLRFNLLSSGASTPANTLAYVNGSPVAQLTMLSRYLGQPFSLTIGTQVYTGIFVDPSVDL